MEDLNLSEFDRMPLHKLVYSKFRESILTGVLKPGERLIENEISKRLQISKTPIREAIRELSQEGLIVHNTRRGITVIDFQESDVTEIVVLRAELEGLGMRLAVPELSDNDLAALNALVDDIAAAAGRSDYTALAGLDMAFHRRLMEKSGNSRLVKAWVTISSQMQVLLQMIDFYALSPGYSEKNHRAILKVLKGRDARKAEETIKEHIFKSRELVIEKLIGYKAD